MLILASASPRRAETLRKLQIPFEPRPVDLDEAIPEGMGGRDAALHLARAKAEAAAADVREGWVLGADTVVWHREAALGKPADAADALRILARLQGDRHEVFTGLCVVRQPGARRFEHVERSEVRMAHLDREAIEAYVATGEPMGKAGAYAVQGIAAAFVEEVRGPVDNVVGLPVRATVQLLARAGYPLPAHLRASN